MRVTSLDEVLPEGEEESLTVLVVEDEILIRLNLSDCLREAGFVVLEAASADEAKLALKAIAEIDAVFSDVNMPSANEGVGLCLWMAAHFPHTPLLAAATSDG